MSDTPRTDALRKTYAGISNSNPSPLLDHHAALERELWEAEDGYKTLVELLRKRFPKNADGSLPAFKIEHVLLENNQLRADNRELNREAMNLTIERDQRKEDNRELNRMVLELAIERDKLRAVNRELNREAMNLTKS